MDIIVEHYEKCYEEHGDTCKGVDWPNEQDANTRYQVMLDVIRHKNVTLLDFGCGLGHLYQYIKDQWYNDITYQGYDLSDKFIAACRAKYPDIPFYLKPPPVSDYVVANGVFTEKLTLTQDEMIKRFTGTIKAMYGLARYGIAFNVMSTHVDWERDDLFHVSMDWMADFVIKQLKTRDFTMRSYGLYEYTTYVYH